MKKHTNSLHPKLYADRIMQIHRHLLGLREKEERFLGDAVLYEQAVQEEKQELEKLKRQEGVVRNKVQQKKELLTAQVTSLETLTKNAVTRIRKLDRKNLDECKQILDGVKNQAVGIETKFIQGVRSLDKEVQTLLSTLNLQTKDYENDVLPAKMGTDKHFSVKRKIEKEPYRAEKSGVGSGVARLFGSLFDKDWGYETRYREYEVVDLEAISKELAAYREKFSKQIAGYLEQWQRRAEAFLQRASAEIRRKTDSLHTKSKSALKKDEAVEVLFQLQNIMDALEKEGTKLRKARLNNAKVTAVDEKSSVAKLSISEGVVGLYQLSHQLMSIPFRTCWSAVQERNQQKHKGLKRSIVWGWDSASLIQFLQRYPGIQMQDQEEEQFTHTGLFISRKKEEIVVVNEAKLQPDSMSGLLKLAKQGQYNIYILFNVIQIGAAEKAFQNSKLLQLPYTRQQPINSVLQSFTELKNADRVQEGLQILFEKLEQWDILQSGELLLNDRNPLYSMISLDLTKPKTILADAQEVLRRAREDYQYLLANPGEEQHLRNFVKGLIDARGGLKK
ncbi:hypothetical protein [Ectobacillus ponti]|uniref:Uncharacterized protein n=1 Tax=Ectobacillus ponti TaxID=2961894 RepID=A0AA42BR44_9BACI|nr:hypothetical protein [Ectobacillus ponti]MCP8970945.1 hypothetical protein [Ectobacillus ponti]